MWRFVLGGLYAAAAAPTYVPVPLPRRVAVGSVDPSEPNGLVHALDVVSAALVGRTYELGPLGEGPGSSHPKPLYRIDAFDCTTFLETVMANAYCLRAGSRVGGCLAIAMRRIRYSGNTATYEARNHIPETDWLPNNTERGYLEDLSEHLFPGEWKEARPTIDRAAWLKAQPGGETPKRPNPPTPPLRYLPVSYFFSETRLSAEEKAALEAKSAAAKKEAAEILTGRPDEAKRKEAEKIRFRADLVYVRAAYAPVAERLALIPSGTVLNLLRAPVRDPEKARVSTLVSHQGLVIQTSEGARIRHAAPNVGHVADQSLADYLLRYVRSRNYRGVALYRILPAQPASKTPRQP
jgi:hypothetical protein